MSSPRPTRWTNPSNPQMLQIATFLLYFIPASAVLWRLLQFGSPTAYYLLGLKLFGVHITTTGVPTNGGAVLLEVVAIAGFAYSAAMIASTKKIGWQLGTTLAVGQAAIPLFIFGPDLFRSDYVIGWLFDVAIVALLLHQQTREHVKIWFD